MQEAETKTVRIEAVDGDIDDATVARFLEYAYTEEYPAPPPKKAALAEAEETEVAPDALMTGGDSSAFFDHREGTHTKQSCYSICVRLTHDSYV